MTPDIIIGAIFFTLLIATSFWNKLKLYIGGENPNSSEPGRCKYDTHTLNKDWMPRDKTPKNKNTTLYNPKRPQPKKDIYKNYKIRNQSKILD